MAGTLVTMTGLDEHFALVRAVVRTTELANELKEHKLEARAFLRTDNVARVQAWDSSTPAARTEVYAAPDGDGRWWLWWSSGEQLAPMTDVKEATVLVTEAVRRNAEQASEN